MIGKAVRLLVLASVAGGIPYVWYQDGIPEFVKNKAASLVPKWPKRHDILSALPKRSFNVSSLDAAHEIGLQGDHSSGEPIETRSTILEQVVRFDVDDRWVTQRWPRVSTILAEPNRQGLRVPLVTGTEFTDLAGSLSYYFDKHRRVRRISFEGHTGDASRLVEFATKQFGVREEPTLKAGLYLARWNAYPTSAIYIRHAPVVREAAPRRRMEVRFEINRPDAGYSLSPEFLSLINSEWLTREIASLQQQSGIPRRETLLDRNAPRGGL